MSPLRRAVRAGGRVGGQAAQDINQKLRLRPEFCFADFILYYGHYRGVFAKIAQSVEHFHGKEEVPGSIPGLGSKRGIPHATLAQLVEHHFRKVGVRSSILRGGSIISGNMASKEDI